VLISGEVLDPPARLYSKNRRRYVRTKVQSGARKIDVIWFADYVVHALTAGESYWFYGRVSKNKRNIMLINPTFEAMDRTRRLQGIMPVYSLGSRMSQGVYAGIVRQARGDVAVVSRHEAELPQFVADLAYCFPDLLFSHVLVPSCSFEFSDM